MADLLKMKVIDLKRELRKRGSKVTGNKSALAERLQFAIKMNINEFKSKNRRSVKNKKLADTISKQSLTISEMPTEIIAYILDYLNLEELGAVSKTCKRMQQIASDCYQQSYSGLHPFFTKIEGDGKVEIRRFGHERIIVDVEHFTPLFDKIVIWPYRNTRNQVLYKFIDMQSEFHQLKKLEIYHMDFRNFQIDTMDGVLSKLEYLAIICCKTNDEFLENLLARTPNIIRLYFLQSSHSGNKWLARCYPTLKHCEIASVHFLPITIFLTHNPNINKFGTNLNNLKNLLRNIHSIKANEIMLDDLAILIDYEECVDEMKVRQFWHLLEEHRRIYKRLNLYFNFFSESFKQRTVDRMTNLSAINRLCLGRVTPYGCVALSGLNHLKDIRFPDSRCITDIATVTTKFECLKRIHFGKSNLSHVQMFMGTNAKLQEIRIDWFMDEAGNNEEHKILNLIGLNKARAKLPNAKKITLFVEEPVYLATKRAKRKIDFDFVKLKRTDTLNQSNFDFDYPEIFCRYVN